MPATLEVGDYVLSPDVCVERKAIPDLIGSLQSGRLYNQAESMCRHYKIPILLIEFEREKSFALQALGDMGSEITLTSTQSRLCLLVLHFPKLRLMWSRSLHATAEMFRVQNRRARAHGGGGGGGWKFQPRRRRRRLGDGGAVQPARHRRASAPPGDH